MAIGDRIKELRIKAGYTQKEVSDLLGGLSQQAVWRYESNTAEPSIDTINKLAEILHVSPNYLLGHESVEPDKARPKARQAGTPKIEEVYFALADQIISSLKQSSEKQDTRTIMDAIKVMIELDGYIRHVKRTKSND